MDRMGRTDQLARCSAGRYLTFDPAEVRGCSATLYATDTRQPAQLHSLRAGRLSSPTPPHYAYVCVLRWDLWAVRGPCLAVVEHILRMRGRPGRRGGSKACLGVGASYHWYPWDLYILNPMMWLKWANPLFLYFSAFFLLVTCEFNWVGTQRHEFGPECKVWHRTK